MKEFRKSIYRQSDEEDIPPICIYRYCGEVNVSGVFGDVITLQYARKDGNPGQQTWIANGSGEVVYHQFGVGTCVEEATIGVDAGNIIEIIWNDGIPCCP